MLEFGVNIPFSLITRAALWLGMDAREPRVAPAGRAEAESVARARGGAESPDARAG